MNDIRHAELQRKLDFLDKQIDTLEREKLAAGDRDLPHDIEEAKEVQQMAREDYSRGDLQKAWLEAVRVEYCLFFGSHELGGWKRLTEAIGIDLELAWRIAGRQRFEAAYAPEDAIYEQLMDDSTIR